MTFWQTAIHLLSNRLVLSMLLTTGIILFWFIVHVGASLIGFHMRDAHFARDSWLYVARRFEQSGRIYRWLGVRHWKDHLPEGDALAKGGFRKKHLPPGPLTISYLERFCLESRRAEFVHWLAALPGPLFFLSGNAAVGASMTLYAVLANLPCIIAQRYNRARLTRLRERLQRQESHRESRAP